MKALLPACVTRGESAPCLILPSFFSERLIPERSRSCPFESWPSPIEHASIRRARFAAVTRILPDTGETGTVSLCLPPHAFLLSAIRITAGRFAEAIGARPLLQVEPQPEAELEPTDPCPGFRADAWTDLRAQVQAEATLVSVRVLPLRLLRWLAISMRIVAPRRGTISIPVVSRPFPAVRIERATSPIMPSVIRTMRPGQAGVNSE